jgi:DMSO/TMAO reductase YedYZ molybdopterin-dependent catalytic subunit
MLYNKESLAKRVRMPNAFKTQRTRRQFLQATMLTGGTLLVGFERIWALPPFRDERKSPFVGGKLLGLIEFAGESRAPLDTPLGTELDARLYTDLSDITPENVVTPTEKFYIRTRASEFLENEKPWKIRVGGLAEKPVDLALEDLRTMVKPAGIHLMECAGNARSTRFGLLSVADWTGAPVSEVLALVRPKPQATRVMVSGFDRYSAKSSTSIPGADWVFTLDQLESSKAFLATEMNGQALPKDHGAPVRLVVPGWYGCTCIKWVKDILLVDEEVEATSQMQEFAKRTHQVGVPKLAKDYHPATIDQAAMPIRVEKWLVDGKVKYRVVGILWGGSRRVNVLEIRFNPDEEYVPVDSFQQSSNDPWSFWTHAWSPKSPGTYMIRLRVKDPPVTTKRLDSGYYQRSVELTEV